MGNGIEDVFGIDMTDKRFKELGKEEIHTTKEDELRKRQIDSSVVILDPNGNPVESQERQTVEQLEDEMTAVGLQAKESRKKVDAFWRKRIG